ncbi:hypothetical protein SteCoe_34221 [Stentor coeruleus]|uniref:Uncharacterized protein n=1 Tax=Stentor coeruleus TaxID=5963 RepID=A0A1R2AV00_9CILI|nr:hypothetical protein SteCoe_34221 [Stentor coeruleus]
MFMVIFNCLGNPFNDILLTIENLIDCELDRVNNLGQQRIFLLLGGVGIVGLSICILALYLLTIDKHLNGLWQFLDKRMRNGFLQIRQLILERLSQYHNIYEIADSEIDPGALKKKDPLKFKHSLWYLAKFSILFIFAAVFYIVLTTVFYEIIQKYLEIRPQLISGISSRRIQITEIAIYTLENEAINTNLSLYQTYPFFSDLKPPKKQVIDIINSLKSTSGILTSEKSKKLMSENLKSLIFESISEVSPFLSMGSFRAVSFFMQESLFILFNKVSDSNQSVIKYLNQVIEFSNITEKLVKKCDSDSKNTIEGMMNNMIYFTVLCLFVIIISFIMFYYPMISKEINVLKKLAKLLVILPSSGNSRQKGDLKSLTLLNNS